MIRALGIAVAPMVIAGRRERAIAKESAMPVPLHGGARVTRGPCWLPGRWKEAPPSTGATAFCHPER